jgi:hypothetical protein
MKTIKVIVMTLLFVPLAGVVNAQLPKISVIGGAGLWQGQLAFGYDFGLKNGSRLGPRISAFVGPYKVMMSNFDTPMNPIIHRLSMEIVYTFSLRKKGAQ